MDGEPWLLNIPCKAKVTWPLEPTGGCDNILCSTDAMGTIFIILYHSLSFFIILYLFGI